MSEKLSEYIGCSIKIKCDKFICSGEIVALDQNTVVITNSTINGAATSTKFLGINHTLIHEMDIIKLPNDKKNSKEINSLDIKTAVNVYSSIIQPPVIKKGGPSSAVYRNLLRSNNNSQEKIHKSRSSIFPDNENQPRTLFQENNYKIEQSFPLKNDIHKSRSFNYNEENSSRSRKTSASNVIKEPSWMNYSFNNTNEEFDFDYNLALFTKSAPYSHAKRYSTESSIDSGGIDKIFNVKNEGNIKHCTNINNKSQEFPLHEDEFSKSFTDFMKELTTKKVSVKSSPLIQTDNLKSVNNTVKNLNGTEYSSDSKGSSDTKEASDDLDVLTELKLMGIIPSNTDCDLKDSLSKSSILEQEINADNILMDHCFLQQPDIIQEVTKSQLSNSDMLIPDQSTILSVSTPSKEFQHFIDFWKLDNDSKFPVFTILQKEKFFDCANKFGYDVRAIAEHVGKYLSEFVIQQIGGISRLNRLNIPKIPKIAVIFGNCQSSVYVVAMARYLVTAGCYVIAYFDGSCHDSNDDIDKEISLLNNAFKKCCPAYGFNYMTTNFKDIDNTIFDYIVTGLEHESNICAPHEDFVTWSNVQKTTILSINPTNIGYTSWKVAAFVGVPTVSSKNLVIRTKYRNTNGLLKPRTDGGIGLEIDKMFKKPDGLVFLFNVALPNPVYQLLNLNYKSPFETKNWIRLYHDNDLSLVE